MGLSLLLYGCDQSQRERDLNKIFYHKGLLHNMQARFRLQDDKEDT